MKPNRRIEEGRRGRRGLVWLLGLVALGLGAALLGQGLPARSMAPEELPFEEALVVEEPAPPPGPRGLPATVIARSALQAYSLSEDEQAEALPADSFFLLESEEALPDLRFRIFDEAHRLVAGEEIIELGQGTRYLLTPKSALEAGSQYTLIAEGQEGGQPTDASGQSYLPARFSFSIKD